MLQSFLLKLGMLVVTMGIIFWIGWTVPASMTRESDESVHVGSDPTFGLSSSATSPLVPAPATTMSLPSQPHQSSAGGKQQRTLVDLNRASAKDFEELPGIGPVLAERIVDYRRSGRTFRTVEDLRAVKGIGKKKFERIRTLVTVVSTGAQPEKGKKAT